jgi:hypothetical protein
MCNASTKTGTRRRSIMRAGPHPRPYDDRQAQPQRLVARALRAVARTKVTDVLFIVACAAPLLLALSGRPGLALMSFCPLLIGACLVAAYYDAPLGRRRGPSDSTK